MIKVVLIDGTPALKFPTAGSWTFNPDSNTLIILAAASGGKGKIVNTIALKDALAEIPMSNVLFVERVDEGCIPDA